MREELFEEILSLVEEFINELDLSTMQSSNDKRKENWENSLDDYLKASKEGNEDKKEEENLKSLKARNKFYKNSELTKKRIAQKVADFKEKLINKKPQTPKQTQQAGSDHANAIIDQHLRNKLEKAFSNECFESLISLIEGELIDFQEKRISLLEKLEKELQDLKSVFKLHFELGGEPLQAETGEIMVYQSKQSFGYEFSEVKEVLENVGALEKAVKLNNGFIDRLCNGLSLSEEYKQIIRDARQELSETRNIQVIKPCR